MEMTRHSIVQMLFNRGDVAESERAERELPERFDTVDADELLTELGIDVPRLDGRREDDTSGPS